MERASKNQRGGSNRTNYTADTTPAPPLINAEPQSEILTTSPNDPGTLLPDLNTTPPLVYTLMTGGQRTAQNPPNPPYQPTNTPQRVNQGNNKWRRQRPQGRGPPPPGRPPNSFNLNPNRTGTGQRVGYLGRNPRNPRYQNLAGTHPTGANNNNNSSGTGNDNPNNPTNTSR